MDGFVRHILVPSLEHCLLGYRFLVGQIFCEISNITNLTAALTKTRTRKSNEALVFLCLIMTRTPSLTGERLWYKEVPSGKSARARKLLPERYRRVFANKQIVCVEYHDITDTDEREIFQVDPVSLYHFSIVDALN